MQCGYGRTGKFFAHDFSGIDADIYCMAKGMGNGFPIGAIAISPKIAAKHFMLGTTFGGNHLACAAAIAVLEIIENENLLKNAEYVGNYLLEQLKYLLNIVQVRGRGLMIGIELPLHVLHIKKNLLHTHHIFTGEAKPNVIRLLPALNITIADATIFLDALKFELNLV